MLRAFFFAILLLQTACAVHNDPPLPVIQDGDPVWELQPDPNHGAPW